jgi:hypothetical protein
MSNPTTGMQADFKLGDLVRGGAILGLFQAVLLYIGTMFASQMPERLQAMGVSKMLMYTILVTDAYVTFFLMPFVSILMYWMLVRFRTHYAIMWVFAPMVAIGFLLMSVAKTVGTLWLVITVSNTLTNCLRLAFLSLIAKFPKMDDKKIVSGAMSTAGAATLIPLLVLGGFLYSKMGYTHAPYIIVAVAMMLAVLCMSLFYKMPVFIPETAPKRLKLLQTLKEVVQIPGMPSYLLGLFCMLGAVGVFSFNISLFNLKYLGLDRG